MRRPRSGSAIGRLMIAIAGIALMLAVLPPEFGGPAVIFLGGFAGLVMIFATVAGVSRVEAAAWAFAAYPLIPLGMLYSTWMVAWASLGHVPLALRDDPKHINAVVSCFNVLTWLSLLGSMPALVACIAIICVGTAAPKSWRHERRGRIAVVAGTACLIWSGAYILDALDPGDIGTWFVD